MTYKFLEHTADIKIAVDEKSLEKAFESSALAMKEIMLEFEKLKIKSNTSKILSIEGKDHGDLLYSFLEEFLYLLDAEDFILSEIEDIEISGNEESGFNLSAKILGDRASNYKFSNKVKAITFNDMKIECDGKTGSTKLQFVLDV